MAEQPVFTTIANRPTHMLHKLSSLDDALVLCRTANGEDVYVPMRELFRLFQKEMMSEIRLHTGGSHE